MIHNKEFKLRCKTLVKNYSKMLNDLSNDQYVIKLIKNNSILYLSYIVEEYRHDFIDTDYPSFYDLDKLEKIGFNNKDALIISAYHWCETLIKYYTLIGDLQRKG